MAGAVEVFTQEQVVRSRRYHRPRYAALLLDLALGLAVLSALAFGAPGDRLHELVDGQPWWLETPVLVVLVVLVSALVRLPVAYWRGYAHEQRWGFSTETRGAWLADRAKAAALAAGVTALALTGLVALVRTFPSWWPLAAAPGAAVLVLLFTFVAPLVVEPLFHRFRPVADAELAAQLRRLAERAGVPVRDILVADASRRTRKENAYVSGLGGTRRLVVFDTLLDRGDPRGLGVVVAHELGHRRARHVAKGTALAMAATALGVLALWLLLRAEAVLDAVGASGAGDPRIVPFVMLVSAVFELLAAPFFSLVSRRWEREADRFSFDLTGDRDAFEGTHRTLALANVGDLDPPRAFYLAFASHPTPPERIAAARDWDDE